MHKVQNYCLILVSRLRLVFSVLLVLECVLHWVELQEHLRLRIGYSKMVQRHPS